jgi:hypothetical protein
MSPSTKPSLPQPIDLIGSCHALLLMNERKTDLRPVSETSDPIDSIHWDKANHLYALSYSTGKLYVYTAETSIADLLK